MSLWTAKNMNKVARDYPEMRFKGADVNRVLCWLGDWTVRQAELPGADVWLLVLATFAA